jgi:hypothetical protein
MLKHTMGTQAVLGGLLLAVAAPFAAAQGRPTGTERERAEPEAQGQQGGGLRRGAEEQPQGERQGETDRARDPQAERERAAQRAGSEEAPGPAGKLLEIERKHAEKLARVERLMQIYREQGNQEKVAESEQYRDRINNQYEKQLQELEREVGPERFRTARATVNEQRRGGGPTDRARDAATPPRRETDAANRTPEQERRHQAELEQERLRREREAQAGRGKPTDRPGDRPVGKPEDRPDGRPADRPVGRPEDRPRGEPPGRPAEKPADKPRGNPQRGHERDGGQR